MDSHEHDMEPEERIETGNRNLMNLIPMTRSKPKKPYPPSKYGIKNSIYYMVNLKEKQILKKGPLILLDRNNDARVINQFGSFYTKTDWLRTMVPSKLHSLVAETVYNGNIQNGYLRWIDHTQNVNMMSSGQLDASKFTENHSVNVELESGCTCLEIMPPSQSVAEQYSNSVEGNFDIPNNGLVNVLAGWDDGSVALIEMSIPEQDDALFGEFKDPALFEDYEDGLMNNKSGMRVSKNVASKRRNQNYGKPQTENLNPTKPNELIYLHKDTVTSIRQRPSYPYQFLTTSLDGEAMLGHLSPWLNHSELEIIRYSNKICPEGIGDSAWINSDWFIAKSEDYGQLLIQDVREGEGSSPTHLFTTDNLCKINDMDVNFPYVGLALDDGTLSILDLRAINTSINQKSVPLFSVSKVGEACMWVKLLKDTVRIYGWYERSGIYGYRFNDDQLSFDDMEWHGEYDSNQYGLAKSLHVIHQEKKEDEDGSIYCQDVLCIGSLNGSYVYGLVHDDEDSNKM